MPAVSTSVRTTLHERIGEIGGNIDRDASVIRNVKLLGRESANGREYSDQALDDAVLLYAGVSVMFEHKPPGTNRLVIEQAGWIENPQRVGNEIRGDFHVLANHERAGLIFEIAERNPRLMGLSHAAEGVTRNDAGKQIVAQLLSVDSLDLVRFGATTRGLFESEGQPEMEKVIVKTSIRDAVLKAPKDTPGRQRLLESLGDPAMDGELELPAEATPEEALDAALEAGVLAVLRGAGTIEEKIEKIGQLLSMTSAANTDSEDVQEAEEAPAEEAPAEEAPAEGSEDEPAEGVNKVQEQLLKRLNQQAKKIELLEAKEKASANLERVRKVFESVGANPDDSDLKLALKLEGAELKRYAANVRQLQESVTAPAPRDAGGSNGEDVGDYSEGFNSFIGEFGQKV